MYSDYIGPQAAEKLIQTSLPKAVAESKLNPVAPPVVEDMGTPAEDQVFSYTAVVDVFPEIDLGERYKGLEVECEKHEVEDSDVEKVLRQQVESKGKKRAVEEGVAAAAGMMAEVEHHMVGAAERSGDRHCGTKEAVFCSNNRVGRGSALCIVCYQ